MSNNNMSNDKEILKPTPKGKETFDAEKTQADFDDFMEKYMSNRNKNDKLDGNSNNLEAEN